MEKFIGYVLGVIVINVAIILFYAVFKECTVKMATIRYCKVIKELLQGFREYIREPEKEYYPVCIGLKSNRIDRSVVNEEFVEVRKNFEACYCSRTSNIQNTDWISYGFEIYRKSDGLSDEELERLTQKQSETVVDKALSLNGIENQTADELTFAQLLPDRLIISIALSDKGKVKIKEARERLYNSRLKECKNKKRSKFTEEWKEYQNNSGLTTFAYQKGAFEQYGLSVPINLNIETYTHVLMTGASGSGKSQALLFLMGKLLQTNPDVELYICDFKNSEDFSFLKECKHYFSGDECYEGIMRYYELFSDIRRNGTDEKKYILICDEYPAFINYLQTKDKLNKTKKANDILGAVAEILMLGRGLGFGFWCVTQRADSSLFANGARDNFMVVIGLGRMSKEQKGMVFAGQDIPDDIIFRAGEGMILADGKEIEQVKYPLIKDKADWKKNILQILNR